MPKPRTPAQRRTLKKATAASAHARKMQKLANRFVVLRAAATSVRTTPGDVLQYKNFRKRLRVKGL